MSFTVGTFRGLEVGIGRGPALEVEQTCDPNSTQTLKNKRLDEDTTRLQDPDNVVRYTRLRISPGQAGSGDVTLPDAPTTLVGTDEVATFTNKTLDSDTCGFTSAFSTAMLSVDLSIATAGQLAYLAFVHSATRTYTFPNRTGFLPVETVAALTDAATIATNAESGSVFTVTLGASRNMGAPTSPRNGQRIAYRITQGGSGTNLITWNAVFRFSTGLPSPTLSTTVGRTDYVEFIYNSTDTKWDCVRAVIGFA